MKYLVPLIVIAVVALTGVVTYLVAPQQVEECCEYIGLLAPDGVSETPGVEHVDFAEADADGNIPAEVPGLKLNDTPATVTLLDLDGKQRTIDFAGNVTVVVWVSSFCPTSKIYEERLNALAEDFRDVRFWAINSSAMESSDELKAHFGDGDGNRLRWTVLKDENNVVADLFGARVSTEAFVFDAQGRLQYRGGIDDARQPDKVAVQYLRTILKQITSGETPEWHYQPSKGCCPIDRIEKAGN
jgi:thiol-disulfide isomerase/thioredoxin